MSLKLLLCLIASCLCIGATKLPDGGESVGIDFPAIFTHYYNRDRIYNSLSTNLENACIQRKNTDEFIQTLKDIKGFVEADKVPEATRH